MGCFLSKSQDVKDAAEAPKPKPVTTVKVKPLQSRTKTVGTVKTEGLELSQNEGGELEHFRADVNATPHLRRGVSCLKIIEENSVLVAVRVRPLNEKEKSSRSPSCVDVTSPTSISLSGSSKKEFNFDCVMREDTTQQEVFDRSARPLLHKVLQGYNGCLFAYGQTGSGKTWTMLGEGKAENKGIIPNLCDELFEQVEARKDRQTFTVQCGMLEIYNENLNDLLVRTSAKEDARDLQIFEDKTAGGRGIYVDGLSAMNVDSPSAVLQLIADGQRRRAVGRTNMNEHSSRSHAVVTLRITSVEAGDEEGISKATCKFHLIDLAGSERARATGATGTRLKEGAQINLSLSALGNVINALTDPSRTRTHVPYRDSKLTRLLQDCLGGNSFTAMICNVSPAEVNAEETLSSLRFAERAKKIQNKARVNIDPKAEKILQLMRENEALKARIKQLEAKVNQLQAKLKNRGAAAGAGATTVNIEETNVNVEDHSNVNRVSNAWENEAGAGEDEDQAAKKEGCCGSIMSVFDRFKGKPKEEDTSAQN